MRATVETRHTPQDGRHVYLFFFSDKETYVVVHDVSEELKSCARSTFKRYCHCCLPLEPRRVLLLVPFLLLLLVQQY
jgi:hypothetical protein